MPNSQNNHIFEYCKTGKTQMLIDALNSSNDFQIVDERQNSVLAITLKHGQWQTAETLIKNNFTYFHHYKPGLISACQFIKDETTGIDLALALNSDIDCQDLQNRTALMTVSLLGHVKKASELLNNNANLNLQDNCGNTALMDAIHSRNKKMVELLLKQNADVNQINENAETALIIELKQKSPLEDIITQLLTAGSNPEWLDKEKKSAWLIAKQKHPKISRLIETHLNNVNQIELPFFSNDYQTQDILLDSSQAVENKIIQKPAINIKTDANEDDSIETKIIFNQSSSNEFISEKLEKSEKYENPIKNKDPKSNSQNENRIEPRINLNATDISDVEIDSSINKHSKLKTEPYLFTQKEKKTNLQEWFHAAKTGNLGGLNRMIIEGIDIDCVDEKGCTALIRASGHSRRAVVSFLLQQNANIEARSHNGSTALSSSIIGNCRRVAGLLLDNGANVNALGPSDYSYVTIAAAQWNDAMLSILYRHGGDIFVLNNSEQTLLHIIALAAEYYNNVNNAKISIQYLLDHGMDINTKDKNGDTALMILCGTHKQKYDVEDRNIASIAHSLIKMGAAAAITNKGGKSALDACSQHKLQQTKGVLMNALSWNN